jgi:hypothetical protein
MRQRELVSRLHHTLAKEHFDVLLILEDDEPRRCRERLELVQDVSRSGVLVVMEAVRAFLPHAADLRHNLRDSLVDFTHDDLLSGNRVELRLERENLLLDLIEEGFDHRLKLFDPLVVAL